MGNVVIIGGTRGIGRELAAELARRGDDIIIAGRSAERANAVAGEISSMLVNLAGSARGTAADLSEPQGLAVEGLASTWPQQSLPVCCARFLRGYAQPIQDGDRSVGVPSALLKLNAPNGQTR